MCLNLSKMLITNVSEHQLIDYLTWHICRGGGVYTILVIGDWPVLFLVKRELVIF